MTRKFRWDRKALDERGAQLRPVREVEVPEYETISQYLARMKRQREARAVHTKVVAAEFDSLTRPLRPPQRKTT